MIREKIESVLARRCTLLCVGPMSVTCVDVVVELANEYGV
ncbi:MAG TPA: tagatose-6-phosphate kinase, partial [Candidatus Omnitrophica bacterium]|nr:tagatose-6-phosphate kinase [Candidatus Omnitrophota bacterium]